MAAARTTDPHAADALPLLSNAFLYKLTALIAALALLTVAISVAGRHYGQRIALGGHTDSTEIFSVSIGEDRLKLPANMIRFARQRLDGAAERVDLYVTWPQMSGYGTANRMQFNDVQQSASLVFLQISQSTMSRDMSGRLEPIYRHLFDGNPQPGPFGLTLHHMRPEAGYGDEVFFTAVRRDQPDYVVRCLLPAADSRATGGDCQRDLHLGRDLSVMYRFSSARLGDWEHIDAEIRSFVENRLIDPA